MSSFGKQISDALGSTETANDVRYLSGKLRKRQEQEFIGTPEINEYIDDGKRTVAAIANNFIDRSVNSIEDPAFNRFLWYIEFNDESGLFADEVYQNSALAYLKRTGEQKRYETLLQVHSMVQTMLSSREYVIQDVNGLGSMNENYTKRGVDTTINMTLLDDVKWSTWFIMHSLNYVFYDDRRQIEVLPINLRRFTTMLYITDVRDLSNVTVETNTLSRFDRNLTNDELRSESNAKTADEINLFVKDNVMQNFTIEIPTCYFKINSFPDSVSNIESTELKHNLQLICKNFRVQSVFSTIGTALNQINLATEEASKKHESLWKSITNTAKATVATAIAGYTDAVVQNLKSSAMNRIYEFAEESGIKRAVNKVATTVYSPNLTVHEYVDKLKENRSRSAYFNDIRYVDRRSDSDAKQQYKTPPI